MSLSELIQRFNADRRAMASLAAALRYYGARLLIRKRTTSWCYGAIFLKNNVPLINALSRSVLVRMKAIFSEPSVQ
jgi:hypothetical protein